jgi:hypothetical protein
MKPSSHTSMKKITSVKYAMAYLMELFEKRRFSRFSSRFAVCIRKVESSPSVFLLRRRGFRNAPVGSVRS